jgi:hypothetical protein
MACGMMARGMMVMPVAPADAGHSHGRAASSLPARIVFGVFLLVTVALAPTRATACPFCGTVGQSLSQQRDTAAAVAVGEAVGTAGADAHGLPSQRFRIDQWLRTSSGPATAAVSTVAARVAGPVAGTAMLFATAQPESPDQAVPRLVWAAVAADESLLGYMSAAPAITVPAADRLRWFAARLEHPDPGIAADAFTEFGLANFADVRAAADALDARAVMTWVNEPGIDARRRGLYGLLAGVAAAAAATDPKVVRDCVAALHRAVEAPADDFRAGFDGILAGVLVAEGEKGLDFLTLRGLFGPGARPMDQRHLLAALRFAWESLADTIPQRRVAAATASLLSSPAVAALATIDLARYQAWDEVAPVAHLWDTIGVDDPLVRRAVAGYLAACPLPAAQSQLDRIRTQNPDLLQRALDAAALPVAR